MPGDFDHVLISIRCSNCERVISAPLVEVRETGVVGCICGTVTRARYEPPVAQTPFSQAGWLGLEGVNDPSEGAAG